MCSYLAASSASAYSMISLVSEFAPLMPEGGACVSLTYLASERVRPRLWSRVPQTLGCRGRVCTVVQSANTSMPGVCVCARHAKRSVA